MFSSIQSFSFPTLSSLDEQNQSRGGKMRVKMHWSKWQRVQLSNNSASDNYRTPAEFEAGNVDRWLSKRSKGTENTDRERGICSTGFHGKMFSIITTLIIKTEL